MNEDNELPELKDSIQRLAEAKTEDFATLVKIAGLDLKQDFVEADLSETDLRGIDLSNADLSGADLSKAKLERAILVNANLENATLKNANLRSADLKGANLINANLKDTNLENADLRGAYFIPRVINTRKRKDIRRNINSVFITSLEITNGAVLQKQRCIAANLSYIAANLIGAEVKNTCFGSNRGIYQLMRQDLEERGAIFEDSPNKPAYAVKS